MLYKGCFFKYCFARLADIVLHVLKSIFPKVSDLDLGFSRL